MSISDSSYQARMNAESRTAMLRSIRNALASAPDEPLPLPVPTLAHDADTAQVNAARIDVFVTNVITAGARCLRAANTDEAADVVLRELTAYHELEHGNASVGVRNRSLRVGLSDAPLVETTLTTACTRDKELCTTASGHTLAREQLFELHVGVTSVRWGIADTGTLVLDTAMERNRLLSLVPPLHIALVPATAIRDTLANVLDELHASNPNGGTTLGSGAVTFITGPSRTSDIELTLVVGVHGPQQLLVIVVG